MSAYQKSWLAAGILAIALLMVIILFVGVARAAGPWYVAPTGNDSSSCLSAGSPCATIDGAIGKASSGDSIYVATGTYTNNSGTEVVLIDRSITLSGGWNAGFTTQSGMSILDGEGVWRGITINSGVAAILHHFTVQNGYAYMGGGVYNDGTLTMNNCLVNGNISFGSGVQGGGIWNGGTLLVNVSYIVGNVADFGGGIGNAGALTLNHSSIRDNTVNVSGGGILNNYTGVLVMNASTVSSNTACCHHEAAGGGIFNEGDLTLNNSTISGNQISDEFAGPGGGIFSRNTMRVNSSTITGNNAYGSGGITIYNNASTSIKNSIIWGNTPFDCTTETGSGSSTIITSGGYNLIGNTTGCNLSVAPGDLLNTDAHLGAIEGSPGYHPLLPGSPALNAGNPAGCMGSNGLLTTDQRNLSRYERCDIGSYEEQALKSVNDDLVLPGDLVEYTISFHNGGTSANASAWMTDSLPAHLIFINDSLTATMGSYGYDTGVITWTGSMNAGSNVKIMFEAMVGESVQLGTVITNSAVINASGEIITRTITTQTDFYHLYQPFLSKPRQGIEGLVTLNGVPIAGIPLELRFFDGIGWSTLAATTTSGTGYYVFLDAPGLGPGQKYYVLYRNTGGTLGILWAWGTRELKTYTAGSLALIGVFDIADIALASPDNDVIVSLPRTFQWTPRPATPSDTYEFDLYDPSDGDPYYYTDPALGYVGTYTLNSLPAGFSRNVWYVWEVWVYSPDGGYGISYQSRWVRFSNSGLVTPAGKQPARQKEVPFVDFLRSR